MVHGSSPTRRWSPRLAGLACGVILGTFPPATGNIVTCCAQDHLAPAEPTTIAVDETQLLSGIRQLTFEGRRAGEGYFSADGRKLVFQSEREPGNPFFQIYLLDLETGDVERVSPGVGKTTCAWIEPSGKGVLFASTQNDPQARQKQDDEIKQRASGQDRRYAWDYDETYDLFRYDLETHTYRQLTTARGYDAEGSYSPDGRLIAFASNRRAYTEQLRPHEAELFAQDPAVMTDIYLMNADGSDVRRLTETLGYDGGPFFSPDGQQICFRRFAENGASAEIMVMNLDGSQPRQLTHLNAISWAPFYHPSGEYLIFATNVHGFGNFELYLVDAAGKSAPVRVTTTDGFDGLPVFSPDGKQMAWTSNRTSSKQSQIFIAAWDHQQALTLLGLGTAGAATRLPGTEGDTASLSPDADPQQVATKSRRLASSDFLPQDVLRHVDYLCRPELGGRMTGTPGELLATSYVAAYFDQLGLEPAGDDGWFAPFDFTAGVGLGSDNQFRAAGAELAVNQEWLPLAFSATGDIAEAPVVFGGYGIVAPADEDQAEYDSFVHLEVKDKWILALRFMPEGISAERRQHLSRHASLRYKAMVARDKGARGLILVSGPNSQVRNPLVPLQFDGTLSGASVPVVSVTDAVATAWLATVGKSLKELQDHLDTGEPAMGFEIPQVTAAARISIEKVKRQGRNVLGRLAADGADPHRQTIIIGAHVDHLGTGTSASSLAREEEKNGVHWGADDNASGVAAMLEIAEYLTAAKRSGKLPMQRDILFAAWSGEELGLIGSSHFANELVGMFRNIEGPPAASGTESNRAPPAETAPAPGSPAPADPDAVAASGSKELSDPTSHRLYPLFAACLNLDMVGRFEKRLVLQGVGSSSIWRGEIERRNAPIGLPITLQDDCYLPTDASTFFLHGVPILSAFTGSHSDYHTPRDTPDKLNYEAAARISRLMGLIARSLVTRDEVPDFIPQTAPEANQRRANLRAYLGTVPDYVETDAKGVKLSGVAKNGPAENGGVRGGDWIVELAGKKIDNIYDYTFAIEALKIGQTVKIVVLRDGQRVELQVTPASRD